VTNFDRACLSGKSPASLVLNGKRIERFYEFYGEAGDGRKPFAIWGSAGFLEISSRNRSASKLLGVKRGDVIEFASNQVNRFFGFACHLLHLFVIFAGHTKSMTDKAKETPSATASTGLRGVVVGASTVSDVVGDKGELIYQGYNIHDLAKHSTFEEAAFLLWNKRLPKQAELDELKSLLGRSYAVPNQVFELMKQLPGEADPIDTLRTAVSALELYDPTARESLARKQPQDFTQAYWPVCHSRCCF
jgi:hypothetical protein